MDSQPPFGPRRTLPGTAGDPVAPARLERASAQEPPRWVCDLVGARPQLDSTLAVVGAAATRIVAGRIADARAMGAGALRHATAKLYGEVRRAISDAGSKAGEELYPLRFWNMLPFIQEPMGDGLDRYMAFNLGRHDAFGDWAGGADHLAGVVPTATGVGHRGKDLFVYALCGRRPPTPVENPRQRPAWRYSTRYGPAPPCFARAGRLELGGGLTAVFVGGTASVRGEDSVAPGRLDEQLAETFLNLNAVIEAGLGGGCMPGSHYLVEARAYCLRDEDAPAVAAAVTAHCPGLQRLEICHADICRAELLVEIEGLVVARREAGQLVAAGDAVAALRAALS